MRMGTLCTRLHLRCELNKKGRLLDQPFHPCGQGLLVSGSGGVGGLHVDAFLGGAVLADFEFAFYTGNGDAEPDDSGQHGALEAVGHPLPLFGERRLVGLDQACQEGLLAGDVFDELKGSVGMDGDVVPGRHREWIDVVGGRDVTVRAREDDQRFAAGEGLPVPIGFGEVALDEAVVAFVPYD